MKKIHILLVAILAIFITSCSSTKTPAGTVDLYLKALKHQEFYEAAKYQMPDNTCELSVSVNIMRNNFSKNPIKRYSILGAVEQSDTRAIVAVKVSWVSDTEPDAITLVPVTKINGKWYVGENQPQEQYNPDMDYYQGYDDNPDYDAYGYEGEYEDTEEYVDEVDEVEFDD